MISVEFTPNETRQDAFLALKLVFQPWKWKKGKDITKLRQRLRKRFFSDKSDIYFFLTGRFALYSFLKSLQLKKGSEVLVQAFTCEAVVLPILALGLKPVYVDINTEDFSMNEEDLHLKYTPQAKVLILQHTFSITPIQRSKILSFARSKKLAILEDIAHGFDQVLFNKKTQPTTLLVSFGRSKSISGVFGGAIITKNRKVSDYLSKAEKNLQFPSNWFIVKMALYKALTVLIKATHDIYLGKLIHALVNYFHILTPEISKKEKKGTFDTMFAKAFPNISALFILQQLNRFNDVQRKKSSTCKYYQDKLRQSKQYLNATLRYPYITSNRKILLEKAKKKNFYLGSWYSQVVAPNELDLDKVGYVLGSCPNAENLVNQIVNLPTAITKKSAQKMVKLIKAVDNL